MAYERIVAHPVRSEAISITQNGILTRWALGSAPRLLAQVVTEYRLEGIDIAVTLTGDELLLVHREDQVERRRWEDLEILGQIPCPTGTEPHHVVVSPDGNTVAVSGFGVGDYLLDRATGQIAAVLSGEPGLDIDFSPNGRWLACVENSTEGGTLFLYEIDADGRPQGRYALQAPEPTARVWANPVFGPDSQWIVVCETEHFTYSEEPEGGFGTLRLFAVEAGQHVWANSLFSPDLSEEIVERAETERLLDPTNLFFGEGEIVCGMPNGELAFYSVETGELTRQIPVASGVPIPSLSVDSSRQAIWSVLDGGQVVITAVPPSPLHSLSPLLPIPSLPSLLKLQGHTRALVDLAYSPDGASLATVAEDRTARLWNTENGQEIFKLELGMEAASVAFSRDGSRIAVAGKSLLVYDALTGQERLRFSDPTLKFLQIVFSPDGPFLLCRFNGQAARVLDADTGQTVLTLDTPNRTRESVLRWLTYLPDGRYFVAVSALGRVEFRKAPTGPQVSHFLKAETEIDFVEFAANGRRCLTGGGINRLWDVATGRMLAEYAGLSPSAFSPDGQSAAGADNRIFGAQIWDALTGEEMARMTGHGDRVSCLAFSPDRKHIATGSWDRTVQIWRLPA